MGKLEALKGLDGVFDDYKTSLIRKKILKIEEQMKNGNLWSGAEEDLRRHKELEKQHDELLQTEETMWRQRSIVVWLKDGGRNSKFFHGKESQRMKVNEIKKLKDENGVYCLGEENVEKSSSITSQIFSPPPILLKLRIHVKW